MTYVLLASIAALASFAIAVVAASAAVTLIAAPAARRLERYAPEYRASVLFGLRVLPALAALVCGFAIALPIFAWFEPVDTDEPVSRTLALIACGGAALLTRAAWRGFESWRATARTARQWQGRGRLLTGFDTKLPVYAIDASFPIVAVVGIRKPALFVAERVLAECSPEELDAMIAHECAHVRTLDNARRFIVRACPDVVRTRGRLERAWLDASEEAADAGAAASRPSSAVDLAHALIRVARLAPLAAPALASAFYAGGSIDSRVRRLLEPSSSPRPNLRLVKPLIAIALVAAAAAIVAAAPSLHDLMETLVRLVP